METEQEQQITKVLENFVIFPCLAKQNVKNRNTKNNKCTAFRLFTVLYNHRN